MTYEALLPEIRNRLDITWADPEMDQKLIGFLNRGASYILDVSGAVDETALDFFEETKEKELLFEYVRYQRSNAFEDFYKNFKEELWALRIRELAKGEIPTP